MFLIHRFKKNIGCVGSILPQLTAIQLTAMCYETTALCALTITWVLSALCARMYFFISALCGLAISWLSTAFCTTITAVLQAWRFVVCIVPFFLASELVRYAISEYKAVVAVVSVDARAAVAVGVAWMVRYCGWGGRGGQLKRNSYRVVNVWMVHSEPR